MTPMLLMYPARVIGCMAFHLASKWTKYKIPLSSEGKPWFRYIDASITPKLLEELSMELLDAYSKSTSRFGRNTKCNFLNNKIDNLDSLEFSV